MKTFEARVVKGKLVIDQPSPYPDGTIVRLLVADLDDDGEDELDDEERAALHAALDKSWKSAKAGHTVPAEKVLARLRAKR
ncbi:MAG: hypothetical protein IT384_30465 [Deltaproteobacteria bacterium]|nr:hypothetical protein [Deltaproteobacteria bacterium]